jgi:Chaperone of endosialidase
VGIGTSAPAQAKLVVNGSAANTLSYGYLNSAGATGTISSSTNNYSIYASQRIAATEFNAYSDARIKNIRGISSSKNDLQALMGIEITDYRLKDSIGKGNNVYKKVIAQQVEKVYPQAVTKMTDVVPDIYKQAEIKEGVVNLATSLKAGDKVKLIFESGEEMATVTASGAGSFTVDKKKTGKIFVFGREVNDFRTVDYEALGTLNISATQELLKRIEQLEKEIKELKKQHTTGAITKQ